MFELGMSHLLVIAVVGLLVLGPEKLPGFAREAVRTWRAIRTFAADTNERITSELVPDTTDLDVGLGGMDLSDFDPRKVWDRVNHATTDTTTDTTDTTTDTETDGDTR
jgi:sec-independent protein translocase protein TatB